MDRQKLFLITGFMPPLCMGALMLLGYMFTDYVGTGYYYYLIFGAQLLIFLIPSLIIKLTGQRAEPGFSIRVSSFSRKSLTFVITIAIATSLFTFLLNSALSLVLSQDLSQRDAIADYIQTSDWTGFGVAVLAVIVPALAEELFFRGAFQSVFEEKGTFVAIFLTSLVFALVHGSIKNLLGPFAASLVYGYLAYALGSFWLAMIAHMLNNLLYTLIGYVYGAYSALGIWNYFVLIAMLAFFIFLGIAMRSLESLIDLGKIKRFKKSHPKDFITALVFTPGLLLLLILFALKTIYF